MLPEPGEDQIGGPARALLERAVGPPVHGDEPGRPAEGKEVGIAAGVGGEAELLAAAAQIAVRDQSAAAQEGAADERLALLDEIGEERLGAIRGAATTDAQRTEDEPAAPAARIARRPGAAGQEPADGSGVAVRDEVRLVARPTSASAGVAYGREAGSRAGGARRGRGGRILAGGEQHERRRGAQTGKAGFHWCLLWLRQCRPGQSSSSQAGTLPAPCAPLPGSLLVLSVLVIVDDGIKNWGAGSGTGRRNRRVRHA